MLRKGRVSKKACAKKSAVTGSKHWVITGAVECDVIVSHVTRDAATCGPFTIGMISDNNGPTVNSTAVTSDTSVINGITVRCFDSGLSTAVEVGSLDASVFGKVMPRLLQGCGCIYRIAGNIGAHYI